MNEPKMIIYKIIMGYRRNKNFSIEDLLKNIIIKNKEINFTLIPKVKDINKLKIGTVKYGEDYKKYVVLEDINKKKYWDLLKNINL